MDLTALVLATSAAASACKPVKHYLLAVSAASSQGRSLIAPLAALSAAVAAVEKATEAAAAAAGAAATGFAAELTLSGSFPSQDTLENRASGHPHATQRSRVPEHVQSHGNAPEDDHNDDMIGRCVNERKENDSILREAVGQLPASDAGDGINHLDFERKTGADKNNVHLFHAQRAHGQHLHHERDGQEDSEDPSSIQVPGTVENCREFSSPEAAGRERTNSEKGNGEFLHSCVKVKSHVGNMKLDNEGPKNSEGKSQPENGLGSPSQGPASDNSEDRMENEPNSGSLPFVAMARGSALLQALRSNTTAQLTPPVKPGSAGNHRSSSITPAKQDNHDFVSRHDGYGTGVNPEASLSLNHENDSGDDDWLQEAGLGSERYDEVQGHNALSVKGNVNGKSRRTGEQNDTHSGKRKSAQLLSDTDSEGKALAIDNSVRHPRAAKLQAKRLVCAPRKRRRLSQRTRGSCADDLDDEQDSDFNSTDDTDDEEEEEFKINTCDSTENVVSDEGVFTSMITSVPSDMSGSTLAPGMTIRGAILVDYMKRMAQEVYEEMLDPVLALQTSQYWSLRCHRSGKPPKQDNITKSKSKKCNCEWRLCMRVLNESETLLAKEKAKAAKLSERDAQIQVAMLRVNSFYPNHTGHEPEAFRRGPGLPNVVERRYHPVPCSIRGRSKK